MQCAYTCVHVLHVYVMYIHMYITCTFTIHVHSHTKCWFMYILTCTCVHVFIYVRVHGENTYTCVTRLPRTCAYVCLCQVNVCLQVLQSSWSPGIRRCEMSTRWIILLPQLAVYIIQNNTWALTRGTLYRYFSVCRGIQKRLEGRSHTHT